MARCAKLFEAGPEAFEAALPAFLAHSEGYQPSLEAGHVLEDYGVEAREGLGVGVGVAAADYLGHVGSVAETACKCLLQHFLVGGAVEIVVGAYDFGAVLQAEFLKILAHLRRRFNLQVGEAGSGLHRGPELLLGGFGAHVLRNPAGGHERGVGIAEDVGYLLVAERAAVQAYLGHLDLGRCEQLQQFGVVLIL